MVKKSTEKAAEVLDRLLQEIKLEDLLIMSAGAVAGSQGYTPMSALIKGMSEGGQDTGVDKIKEYASLYLYSQTFNPLFLLVGFLLPTNKEEMTDSEKKAQVNAYALAAIGMIEAYAITRPGAIQGIADIVGSLAGVISGVGSNAAAAAKMV
jgi:hypothetical protein